MKMLRLAAAVFALATLAPACAQSSQASAAASAVAPISASANTTVYHIVAFRFKTDDATRAKIPAVVQAFADLKDKSVAADGGGRHLITSFRYGVNNSTEQVTFGTKGVAADRSTEYDFIATFASVADRDYYVNEEPNHQEFKKLVGTILEDGSNSVFVTDFAQ